MFWIIFIKSKGYLEIRVVHRGLENNVFHSAVTTTVVCEYIWREIIDYFVPNIKMSLN